VKAYLEILKLVWPLALGMVNNAAMQFVDRAYLANESMASLEAVMPATTLAWVFLGFFQAIVSYSGVFVAQYHGAGDDAGCVRSYHAGLCAAALSAVLLLPLVPLGDGIFRLTATTHALATMESAYYDIALFGSVFLLGQMAATAYFTGRGKTSIVFWVNLVGNLLNVALDPILIYGWWGAPRLGIAGAAYATVASQAVQFAVLALAVWKVGYSDVPMANRCATQSPFTTDFLRLLRFGVPAGGYEILNMLSFTIFIFVTGRMDPVSFAVSNACFTINYLLFAPMLGFALGAQTLVGQARGRRDDLAAQEAFSRTLRLALGFLLVVFAFVFAFYRPILALFAPSDLAANGEFMSTGVKLLMLMTVWIFIDATDIILSGALKGAGDTKFVFWWMLVSAFGIWLPLVAVAFYLGASMPVLWSTMIVYVFINILGSWYRWHRGPWRHIELVFDVSAKPH